MVSAVLRYALPSNSVLFGFWRAPLAGRRSPCLAALRLTRMFAFGWRGRNSDSGSLLSFYPNRFWNREENFVRLDQLMTIEIALGGMVGAGLHMMS
jgi:hypothetical protein